MKKILSIFLCCLLVFVFATGCRPAERPVPQDPMDPNRPMAPDQRVEEVNPYDPNVRAPREEIGQDLNIRADRIVNEIVKLNEVKSATVVITDKTALVGVNLKENIDGEMTTESKKKIENVVRRTDSEIDRVSVSADPEIFDSIENIVRETGRGRPLSSFGDEIEDIVRRITPGA
ncbi:YhcN/YlaJ family sporulation lipoprotein [Alkaliphilus hydrothermalis]|uniref:YhcN/YlaJ family sporulation lipoprotein n=1 Tax=Alkaliphilus hydrothermalis TaxID=1482730 RepID=A0ABS2NNU0_9FIRM|nr:YhcN/YlaJ family sporulation lipoprotein [Alkaliphilus hydrothermalis]MBM7614602.1 YhcN/YlaJ family sporulation lipoprotein [Alkaliphilus hydrothermalis]